MRRNPILFGMVHVQSSLEYTKVTLDSFFKNTLLDEHDRFILIDNDNSFSEVNFNHSRLEVVLNNVPTPFSKNANYFIAKSLEEKKDLFLLNNDIIFSKNWLMPFENPVRAIRLPVSNAQFQYKKNNLILKLSMTLGEYLGYQNDFEDIAESHVRSNSGLKLVHTAPYFCVYIPYVVLSAIGFFDEQFVPAGWEDTDYTVRAYVENIPVYYVLNSFVLHFYGKSTWSVDNEKPSQVPKDIESAKLFEKKWGSHIAKLFGYQTPELLSYMQQRIERATILETGKIIQNLKVN